jgi:tetratricopeptide (TPR) repeat protein
VKEGTTPRDGAPDVKSESESGSESESDPKSESPSEAKLAAAAPPAEPATPPAEPSAPAPTAPTPSGPRLDEVNALCSDGRNLEALRKLEPMLKEFPNAADAWFVRARILVGLGQLEVAITSLEKVTRLDKKHRPGWRLMASCWRDLKRADRALELADRVVALAPDDLESQQLRARVLVDLKRLDDARAVLERMIDLAEKCRAADILNEARALLEKI